MKEQAKPEKSRDKIKLGPKNLKTFFIEHLNKIYSAKAHLVRNLPGIADEVHYADLHDAILETVKDVEKQMARMELVMTLLDAAVSDETCSGIIGMVEEAFQSIRRNKGRNHGLRDLAIAYYMQNIESVEMSSFQVLQMAAVKLKDKQVTKLLNENYREARADRVLMLLIATKYVIAV